MKNKHMKGQAIIEILVALTTAMVVIAAIVVAVISALNNVQFSKNQNLATQYAQEAMEIVRQIRNSDWNSFNALSDGTPPSKHYCLSKGSTQLGEPVTSCPQNADNFVREVEIEKSICEETSPITQTKITVSVSWSDSKCTDRVNIFCHNVELISCLSDFNVIPSP